MSKAARFLAGQEKRARKAKRKFWKVERKKIRGHILNAIASQLFNEHTAQHKRQKRAVEGKTKAKESKEDELDVALEKVFKKRPEISGNPVEISLELAAHPEYFPGGKVLWLGKGYRRYSHLQTKIREALKRRK